MKIFLTFTPFRRPLTLKRSLAPKIGAYVRFNVMPHIFPIKTFTPILRPSIEPYSVFGRKSSLNASDNRRAYFVAPFRKTRENGLNRKENAFLGRAFSSGRVRNAKLDLSLTHENVRARSIRKKSLNRSRRRCETAEAKRFRCFLPLRSRMSSSAEMKFSSEKANFLFLARARAFYLVYIFL